MANYLSICIFSSYLESIWYLINFKFLLVSNSTKSTFNFFCCPIIFRVSGIVTRDRNIK